MKSLSTVLGIIILVVVFFVIAGCGSYNRLIARQQEVNSSWADVENMYQRRADLVPNLVNTVQGAANFEKSTLTDVIKARQQVNNVQISPASAPTDAQALQQFQSSQDALSGALSRLMVVVERYPDLKANANFQELQAQLEGTENRIAVSRRKFNEAVQAYNVSAQTLPVGFFARFFGFLPRPYFQASAGAENAPQVNFNFGAPGSSPTAVPASTP